MDPRYQDPDIADLFESRSQYAQWLEVGRAVVRAQQQLGIVPGAAANAILDTGPTPDDLGQGAAHAIWRHEAITRHDVAAFLAWWRQQVGSHGRWIHFGLTSSDLVDTAAALRFKMAQPLYGWAIQNLDDRLTALSVSMAHTPVLGFTHGQPAEPTTLGIRVQQWGHMLRRVSRRLDQAWEQLLVAKISGPVGTYAHNPPEVELQVAELLGLAAHGPGASQVVPRDRLAAWASNVAQIVGVVSKIAIDFRLMAARGEVREGWPEGRIGSSAMPHKQNPVTAEKLSGLARLANGYAAMLQPVDLWDERDISHSCVERVAVPDLLHVGLHALRCAGGLLLDAQWNTHQMAANLASAGRRPFSSWYAYRAVAEGRSAEQARQEANRWVVGVETHPTTPPAGLMTQHHPLTAWQEP